MDELDNTIVLHDENGNETVYEFLDLIEYKGEKYVVLLPCDEAEDSEEVLIYKLEDSDVDDDEEFYVGVESEEDLEAVFEIFKDRNRDEFNFIDGE